MTYLEKLRKRIDESGSNLCVGLDPRPDYIDGDVRDFLLRVVDETQSYAAAYKPNMAYFEAMGFEGMLMLQDVLDQISPEIPVIQDGKRGDIGETQRYYARAEFNTWEFDAATLNPYMGADTIQPFLEHTDKGVYLLAVTSNQGAKDIQLKQTRTDHRHVFEIVQDMTGLAAQIGLVVGLTNAD
ncbi:MAG: orotidine-5'-phosphate decarboxylase, partial [Verrucomicrobiota bacterium]